MKSWIYGSFASLVIVSLFFISGLFEPAVSGFLGQAQFARQQFGQDYKKIYKEQDRSKLIKFSHKFHIEEAGAECGQCHEGIKSSTASSENFLSKMDNCYQCHDQKTTECSFCHLEKSEPYTAFAAPKRELVFSHAKHVKDGQTCESCHAAILEKDNAVPGALPVMEKCSTCHDGAKATSECAACHTDIRFILPADHKADWIRTHHQKVAAQGDANCIMCHSQASCQECHEGGMIESLKKKSDFITSRRLSGMGNERGSNLETVHSLDYLFTHRFDAKAKSKSCQTCHETEQFCVQCHSGNDKVSKPAWHSVAGFTVANAGGIHATLAKKDLESCTSCHNLTEIQPGCAGSGCHTF